jgi:hypothetical protein
MSKVLVRLKELGLRIELVATRPDEVPRGWRAFVAPLMSLVGWRPKIRVERMQALLRGLAERENKVFDNHPDVDVSRLLDAAIDELEDGVQAVEVQCATEGRAKAAYAACLRRLYEVVARVARAEEAPPDERATARRLATAIDPTMALAPIELDLTRLREHAREATTAGGVRLLELQLGAIDRLLDAARDEPHLLARRRHFLEGARQLLLESAAALPLDAKDVEARRSFIAREITRIDRLEAAGVDANVALAHQARTALARGERERLHAVLVALDGVAVARGDARLARRTDTLIGQLRGSASATIDDLEASAHQTFGREVVGAVDEGFRRARASLKEEFDDEERKVFFDVAQRYLAPGRERSMLAATLAVDGCFEVGAALTPTRAVEYEVRARLVRHPTPDMVLVQAQEPAELPEAIIGDPRAIVLDLAAGRLLARRFVKEERVAKPRRGLRAEVRVFVLDGSTSMLGPRARMRDAIMVAELSTLMQRLDQHGRQVRLAVYYRYFDSRVHETTRVDSRTRALAAITDVLSTVREGGTDIEAALVASFQQIRAARAQDPELARAQIVLVTDGAAPVRDELVDAERKGVEDLPIALSVIALGEQNEALRAIVARQRSRGERAFYHFIDDAALKEVSQGTIDRGRPIHVPALPEGQDDTAALKAQIGELLDEIAALDQRLPTTAAALDLAQSDADPARPRGEGEQARIEVLQRDARALERRYARWFPPSPSRVLAEAALPAEGTVERDDLDAALVTLTTVAEAIAIGSGSELARRADAIDVLERLLPDARLSPARYWELARLFPSVMGRAIAAVHQAVAAARP